jgi:hypothetical protein
VTGLRSGEEITGELLLPNGPLPVRVVVRTVLADGATGTPAALGGEFLWGLSDERNQLELFLFGSDLQWRINGFEERVRTPFEWARDLIRGGRPARHRLAGRDWMPVVYRRVNAAAGEGVGYISSDGRDGEIRTIVSLGALPTNGRLYAEEVTPAGARGVVGRVDEEVVIETHSAPIYLYRLTA